LLREGRGGKNGKNPHRSRSREKGGKEGRKGHWVGLCQKNGQKKGGKNNVLEKGGRRMGLVGQNGPSGKDSKNQ